MNANTLEAIKNHGRNILTIFPNTVVKDPLALCLRLRRIETAAHKNAEAYCNGEYGERHYERKQDDALARLVRLLGVDDDDPKRVWFTINGDPRGYALKIRDHVMRESKLMLYQDWGGYGILAPDLTA